MNYTFPEALDAVIEDNAYIRRACNAKQSDKYIFHIGHKLLYNNLEPYVPTNEDIFATDWQTFGKGVLGTGNNNETIVDQRHKGRAKK